MTAHDRKHRQDTDEANQPADEETTPRPEPEDAAASPAGAEAEFTAEPEAAEVTAEEVTAAEPSREEALEAEVAELKERLLRALAETENLRRRAARDLEEARKYAITGFARDLLEVADNLGRALQSIPESAKGDIGYVKNLAEGVEMTEKSLLGIFERHRIAKVEPQPGDRFDPNLHQAMFEVATADLPPGTIAQVLQAGYVIEDRLLRPALVGVAKAAPDAAEAPADERGPGGEERPGRRVDTSA